MENFVEILKTVGKFLAIFIAKIVYYFVKGCIAFGKYCVIGFNFARKYVVKFIKEKQWEVVTAKFGKVKTSKWNQTKVSDGIESNGVNGKKPSWMNQSPKPVTYTPEESMDKAYRAERTTTPIVDPGHHAEKNKVTVKAVEEMSSFNGAVVVKESNAKPLPTHATVEEVPAVQETPAAPETIDNQATPEAHSEILNQVLGRAKRQSRLQNDEVVVQNDEV
ncbi:MAG: hypothetical protein Q4F34_07660, partial [Prevotellaceae bacterium]|nr:hypothetical protein [Prevotellaceae bacterium]